MMFACDGWEGTTDDDMNREVVRLVLNTKHIVSVMGTLFPVVTMVNGKTFSLCYDYINLQRLLCSGRTEV